MRIVERQSPRRFAGNLRHRLQVNHQVIVTAKNAGVLIPERAANRTGQGSNADQHARLIIHLPIVDGIGKDDTREACEARLTKYHSETAPIIPFYRDQGLLKEVDGVGTPDEVTERLKSVLS